MLGGNTVAPVGVCDSRLLNARGCQVCVGPDCGTVAIEFGPVALQMLSEICVMPVSIGLAHIP